MAKKTFFLRKELYYPYEVRVVEPGNKMEVEVVGDVGPSDFYFKGVPFGISWCADGMVLWVQQGTRWNNSQEYWLCDINPERAIVEDGVVFVNGVDIAIETRERLVEVRQRLAEKKAASRAYFQEKLKEAEEVGLSVGVAKAIVRRTNKVAILVGVINLITRRVDKKSARRVAEKAFAWAYADAVIGINSGEICHYLDDVKVACKEYANL